MVLPTLVRSVAVSSAVVGAAAAHCGLDPRGFATVPVSYRTAQTDVCGTTNADALARATAYYGWNASSPIYQTPSGYSITTRYSLFVDKKQSRIEIVLPQGTNVADAASVPYFCPLLGHELGHLQVAQHAASLVHGTVHVSAKTLTAAENTMRSRVATLETAAVTRADVAQLAYDNTTDHGFSQHLAGSIDPAISLRDLPPCKPLTR